MVLTAGSLRPWHVAGTEKNIDEYEGINERKGKGGSGGGKEQPGQGGPGRQGAPPATSFSRMSSQHTRDRPYSACQTHAERMSEQTNQDLLLN